jgi:hypothetical protein
MYMLSRSDPFSIIFPLGLILGLRDGKRIAVDLLFRRRPAATAVRCLTLQTASGHDLISTANILRYVLT